MSNRLKWILGIIAALVIAAVIMLVQFFVNTTRQTSESVVEKISALNHLTTAEAYTKVIIEKENNKVFGKEINLDIPGTKQKIVVIVGGQVRAGIDLSQVKEDDVTVDNSKKTITIRVPKTEIQGTPTLDLENVEVFSSSSLFRQEATVKDGYTIAKEAKKLMVEEAKTQGLLQQAEDNARTSLEDMFKLVDYKATIQFEEQ